MQVQVVVQGQSEIQVQKVELKSYRSHDILASALGFLSLVYGVV